MITFYVYGLDGLKFLGTIEADDDATARELAAALWPVPLKVLSWRLRPGERLAA
jgi:hypothetical protein